MENGVGHAQVSCERIRQSCTCVHATNVVLVRCYASDNDSSLQAPRRYLTYLPQDNDGLANAQSEQVLGVINEDLGDLLSSSDTDFWEVLATEGSLTSCLDSFLRFARYC